MKAIKALVAIAILATGIWSPAMARDNDDFGVLVMAHGGSPTWNREVESMLAPLKEDYELELAFGMADPVSMEAAIRRLEASGVERIAVVRLFISGESFRERTEQILGIRPGAAAKPAPADGHDGHGNHGGHSMDLWRVDSDARFVLSAEGLANAPEMGAVLAERARGLSRDATRESVLILAHGPEDDAENQRWIAAINDRADAVRTAAPFHTVTVMTLREDWPEKRSQSETAIRDFVRNAGRDGGRAIIIPYRVQGFGPYAKVLEGLDYVSDGRGLLPSDAVQNWVRRQAEALRGDLVAGLPTTDTSRSDALTASLTAEPADLEPAKGSVRLH